MLQELVSLELRRKATMIKGCQRAALGKWWGCSSEGRYSFHARATSWTPPA